MTSNNCEVTGYTTRHSCTARMTDSGLELVRMTPNLTNLELFKVKFQYILTPRPKCTETDLKKSHISPIWGQSDPFTCQIFRPWE